MLRNIFAQTDHIVTVNIRREMNAHGTTADEMCHALNVSVGKLDGMLSERASWTVGHLYNAAGLFRVKPSDFLIDLGAAA